MFSEEILSLSKDISQSAIKLDLTIATAESFTCGLLATALTSIPGASRFFDRAIIAYSCAAKTELLGVPSNLIKDYGAVSRETVIAMAKGLLSCSKVDFVIATTGNAGPSTDNNQKPIGLAHFAWASKKKELFHQEKIFASLSRQQVQMQAVEFALRITKQILCTK